MSSPPEPAPPLILVVAAVIIDRDRVLLTQRKSGAHLAGTWEFPGGKVEPGEDPCDALLRELHEEIGVRVTVGDIVDITYYRYPTRTVLLLFYAAALTHDSPPPAPLDVAAVRWAEAEDLRDELFPPADIAVLAKVRARLAAVAPA